VLRAGVVGLGHCERWRELSDMWPSFPTCHLRFQHRVHSGKTDKALGLLAKHLHKRGKLGLHDSGRHGEM
jgi:hypothetical protein